MTMRRLFWVVLCCASIAAVGCGGSSHNNSIVSSGPNVQAITVNAGPNGNYVNGAFTSVNVCVPGSSSNCQTISGILVDTGSFGLRILSSALTVALPQQNASDGNPVVECALFANFYTWGPVRTADIHISQETASSIPIQVLSDTPFQAPSSCSRGLQSADTLSSLGANGILGIGELVQDCGTDCTLTGPSNPGVYYECLSSGCVVTEEAVATQVANPVAFFANDNNGVIVELPAVNGSAATVNGSLVFGIGTQSNNGLGSATVYAVNSNADITTKFGSNSYDSFLDSGSNGIFFLDSTTTGIPMCSSGNGFYCPTTTQNLKATNDGSNGASEQISFSVGNADNLFTNGDSAYSQLGGPNPSAFDWGLPFFYGRNVFTAINGASTPAGTGPYWAY